MPEDKSESNKDLFDSHPCFMEKSEKMQADVKVKVLYLECKIIQCLCTSWARIHDACEIGKYALASQEVVYDAPWCIHVW